MSSESVSEVPAGPVKKKPLGRYRPPPPPADPGQRPRRVPGFTLIGYYHHILLLEPRDLPADGRLTSLQRAILAKCNLREATKTELEEIMRPRAPAITLLGREVTDQACFYIDESRYPKEVVDTKSIADNDNGVPPEDAGDDADNDADIDDVAEAG